MTEAEKAVNRVFEREAQLQTLAGLSEAITDLRSRQIHVAYSHQNIIYQPATSRGLLRTAGIIALEALAIALIVVFRAQIVEFLWGSMQLRATTFIADKVSRLCAKFPMANGCWLKMFSSLSSGSGD